MTLTKICGLTTPDTLDAALQGGAAFVGAVVFPKSPRHIPPLHAATLFDRARGRAKIVVAVLVDPDDALLSEVALILRPDLDSVARP
jgi:phosphoribosylanthranilate isomerase